MPSGELEGSRLGLGVWALLSRPRFTLGRPQQRGGNADRLGPAQDLDQHECALLARWRLEYLLEEAAEPLEWAALDLDWLALLKEGFFWGLGLAQLVNGLDQCVGDAGGVLRYPKTQQVQDALGRSDRCPVGLLGLATHKAVPRKEGLGLVD